VTATYPGDREEKVFETDGRALPNQEVRIVGEDGAPLPTDTEGRLQARGPTMFVGYFKRPEAYTVDEALWFETGDNARMDADGYIRITGRSKDIIIRGGENVPVVEIEELLYRHPAVKDAAVIGIAHERLGELGCAFVELKPGASLTFDEMVTFLLEYRLAKNYLPEQLEIISEFPRTASGKIQKFKLRTHHNMVATGP
jgi:cyclohexanecarboxylate-CoA ligase